MSGVPILNKIPYVSRLFKNTGVGRETESLMLMVTPRIIIQEEEEELLGIPKTYRVLPNPRFCRKSSAAAIRPGWIAAVFFILLPADSLGRGFTWHRIGH